MQVKNALLQNNNIELVLDHFGYANITDRGDEVRCGLTELSNPTSICIYKDESLRAVDFGRNIQGDIFTLIIEHRSKTFPEIINEIKSLIGIEIEFTKNYYNESVFRILDDVNIDKDEPLNIYPESILDNYENKWNQRFLRDGISIQTQKKFNIRYDTETHRIVIPHRTPDGEICGVIGRINYDSRDKYTNKYFPLIRYKKSKSLFGYAQNYKYLYGAKTIYIGESEKFVMQLDTMGYHNGVSLSGSSISKEQVILIARLNPERIVFCFDEGLDEMVIYRNTNKFKLITEKLNIEVGIIIDRENKYLPEGSKDSPSDKGKYVWEKLINDCYEVV